MREKLTDKQRKELKALAELPDDEIDFSDIPEITNWDNAVKGRFYYPIKETENRQVNIMKLNDRITLEAGKRGGKPCIRGLRITVYDVLGWLALGMTYKEIIEDFPELEKEDIQAALLFASDREQSLQTLQAA